MSSTAATARAAAEAETDAPCAAAKPNPDSTESDAPGVAEPQPKPKMSRAEIAAKMRLAKAKKQASKSGSAISRHRGGRQKQSSKSSAELASELGLDPSTHPSKVEAECRKRSRSSDPSDPQSKKTRRRTRSELARELDTAQVQARVAEQMAQHLSRDNAKKAKKIEILEDTVARLKEDIKVANNVIADLMHGAHGSWNSAVELYIEWAGDEGCNSANPAFVTLHNEFVKKIRHHIDDLDKSRRSAEKLEQRWRDSLTKLEAASDKVHEEKMRSPPVDLEIMLDNEKKQRNHARKLRRESEERVGRYKGMAEARLDKLKAERLEKNELAQALLEQQEINRKHRESIQNMEKRLQSNEFEKLELEKEYTGRGGSRWPNWVVLLICELLVNGVNPSAVPPTIQTSYETFYKKPLDRPPPSVNFIRECRTLIQIIGETVIAMKLSTVTNWMEILVDGTTRRQTPFVAMLISILGGDGVSIEPLIVSSCIFIEEEDADTQVDAMLAKAKEKKLGDSIPKNPTADFSGFKRREIQTYGTPSSAIKALDDKRRIRCDKVKLQAVDIIAERDLKKEGSLYSHMQPVKSPPWNELVGQRIDVLFAMQYEYPEGDDESCDVKEELRWCQGEVLKILSVAKDNKAASFQVEWDAMADMIGEFTQEDYI
ncbi:hypothetical protein THAOC_37702 [Thalassiosira oceanica]|uniref:Uncharacterized protein n=1 Tax=Thalassiosira oceanica TaxID=159749 RepID=K0R5J0_THAOC|nr:hypothetical protein THAOC_37702 [Thalassiosira oceanica]|eukprot:EJK43816.1 hypothetical protein THAOC_37702 [Thalassiosira oceanica]